MHGTGGNNVLLFGLPEKKDPMGSQAHAKDGIIQTYSAKDCARYLRR